MEQRFVWQLMLKLIEVETGDCIYWILEDCFLRRLRNKVCIWFFAWLCGAYYTHPQGKTIRGRFSTVCCDLNWWSEAMFRFLLTRFRCFKRTIPKTTLWMDRSWVLFASLTFSDNWSRWLSAQRFCTKRSFRRWECCCQSCNRRTNWCWLAPSTDLESMCAIWANFVLMWQKRECASYCCLKWLPDV